MEHLPPGLQDVFENVGSLLGLNLVLAAFLSLQIANLLIAFGFRYIAAPSIRKIVSGTVGLLWCWILHDVQNTLILLGLSTGVYFLAVQNIVSPPKITMLAIVVLSYFHISRMITAYMSWSLDVTAPLMLLTAKYTTFAYDLEDGRKKKKDIALSADPHVADARSKTCVVEAPTLMEYYVFIFDFLGIIAGPIFGLREYLDFLYLRNDFADLKHVHFLKIILERLVYALLMGGAYAIAGTIPYLSFDYTYTDAYMNSSFFGRLVAVHLMSVANRLKYYFAWYMSDVAGLISGIGYNPTNRDKFSRSQNAIFTKVDLANCQAEAMSRWNISISKWLRCCIYLRANEAPLPRFLKGIIGHRQYATILTRFVSAFWHGFYPGYYLAFLCTVFQFEADSVARKYIKPLFIKEGQTKPHWIYTLVGKIHTAYCLETYGSAFLVLSASASLHIWTSLYFAIHLFNIATIIFVPVICKKVFHVKMPKIGTPPNEKKSQ